MIEKQLVYQHILWFNFNELSLNLGTDLWNNLYGRLVRLFLRSSLWELEIQIVPSLIFRVEGFSFNYEVFNVCGYLFYSFYCTLGFFFHQQGAGTVVISDLVFAYHSLLMVAIEGVQCFIYKVIWSKLRKAKTECHSTP